MGFFEKLKNGLSKTKNAILGKIDSLFRAFHRIDEDLFAHLVILYPIAVNAMVTIGERILRKQ